MPVVDQLMTQQLSPAAQAVLDAVYDQEMFSYRKLAAAAIRAAADEVVPLHICGTTATRAQTRLGMLHKLLAIADELDGIHDIITEAPTSNDHQTNNN